MSDSKRPIQLHFYVSEKEYEVIKDGMADLHIRSLSAYLRRMALAGYIIHFDISKVGELSRVVGNCSNNLNQYARVANETGSIYKADIDDLIERQTEIRNMVKELVHIFSLLTDTLDSLPKLNLEKLKKVLVSLPHD